MLTALMALASCNNGGGIQGISPTAGPSPATKPGDAGTLQRPTGGSSGGDRSDDGGTTGDGIGGTDVDETPAAIEYPVLGLNGLGETRCSKQMRTTSSIETSLDDATLKIDRRAAKLECYEDFLGTCDQSELDTRVGQEALGIVSFKRPTRLELKKFQKDGVDVASYAINALAITTQKGESYVFDKPMPIFPFPGPAGKYGSLGAGSKTYTASVTGTRSHQVQMTVRKVSQEAGLVKLEFTLVLDGNASDRRLYDKFPIPKRAVYIVNTETQDVREMQSEDWFTDDKCENAGMVTMTYKLCTKTKAGKIESFPCN